MRQRAPEPMAMDDAGSVDAFDSAHRILQAPIYRLNALALSRLLPEGGTLLDLGSGTGRLLMDLARARPDVLIHGRDLAPNMVRAGRRAIAAAGLDDRMTLDEGDMTRLEDVPEHVDAVSCIWALHHARMQHEATFRAVMDAVSGVPRLLYKDGLASERAAWTAEELEAMLQEAGLDDMTGGAEERIGHVQAWSSDAPARDGAHERLWEAAPLEPEAASALAERLADGLPALAAA